MHHFPLVAGILAGGSSIHKWPEHGTRDSTWWLQVPPCHLQRPNQLWIIKVYVNGLVSWSAKTWKPMHWDRMCWADRLNSGYSYFNLYCVNPQLNCTKARCWGDLMLVHWPNAVVLGKVHKEYGESNYSTHADCGLNLACTEHGQRLTQPAVYLPYQLKN